jgi:hypothetical protein
VVHRRRPCAASGRSGHGQLRPESRRCVLGHGRIGLAVRGHRGRPASGHAAAALPRSVMNSRRFIRYLVGGPPVAALQADGETRSVNTASSIRRRSAAWTILLDWTFRSRRRASALWMTQARSFGKYKVASEPEALLAVLKNLAYHFKRIGLEAGPLSQRALVDGVAGSPRRHTFVDRKQDRFDSAWPRAAAWSLTIYIKHSCGPRTDAWR